MRNFCTGCDEIWLDNLISLWINNLWGLKFFVASFRRSHTYIQSQISEYPPCKKIKCQDWHLTSYLDFTNLFACGVERGLLVKWLGLRFQVKDQLLHQKVEVHLGTVEFLFLQEELNQRDLDNKIYDHCPPNQPFPQEHDKPQPPQYSPKPPATTPKHYHPPPSDLHPSSNPKDPLQKYPEKSPTYQKLRPSTNWASPYGEEFLIQTNQIRGP